MRIVYSLALLLVLGSAAAPASTRHRPALPATEVLIRIAPTFGPQRLQLHQPYKTLGQDSVKLTRFACYLSNFRLRRADGLEWAAPASVQLLEVAEQDSSDLILRLTGMPAGSYTEVQFAVGLDSLTNHGGNRPGVLSPDFGMFWSWESNYVFLKCEGYFQQADHTQGAFVYHVARDESYRAVRLPLSLRPLRVAAGEHSTLHITADARCLFGGFPGAALTLALAQPNPTTSIMAGPNGRKLADNYAQMFGVSNGTVP